MMNLVRSLAVGENQAFKNKFRELLHQMINPMVMEIETLKQEGRVRKEIDAPLAGYFLMGLGEYGASLINQGAYSMEEVIDFILDLMQCGLLK
jgi:hypothetical protein